MSYNTDLQNNNVNLQSILDKVNALPEADNGDDYVLPVATETTLGGVKASAKTEDMTQPVGIGEDGFLFTAPGASGGGKAGELVGTWTLEEETSEFIVTLDEPPYSWWLEVGIVGTPTNDANKDVRLFTGGHYMAYLSKYIYADTTSAVTSVLMLQSLNTVLQMDSFLHIKYNGDTEYLFTASTAMKTGAMAVRSHNAAKSFGNNSLSLNKVRLVAQGGGVFGVGTSIRVYKINGV